MLNTEKFYLHTILRNTVCWTLWEDLFTQNTEEYCTLNTEKIYLHKILSVFNIQYSSVFCVNKSSQCSTFTIPQYFVWINLTVFNIKYSSVFCVNKSYHSGHHTVFCILYAEYCGNIHLHKILRNTVCWTLRSFIYTQYWGILYVEHCGKIYLHKISRNIVPQCSTRSNPKYFV
jgi:hypothetical protein